MFLISPGAGWLGLLRGARHDTKRPQEEARCLLAKGQREFERSVEEFRIGSVSVAGVENS